MYWPKELGDGGLGHLLTEGDHDLVVEVPGLSSELQLSSDPSDRLRQDSSDDGLDEFIRGGHGEDPEDPLTTARFGEHNIRAEDYVFVPFSVIFSSLIYLLWRRHVPRVTAGWKVKENKGELRPIKLLVFSQRSGGRAVRTENGD